MFIIFAETPDKASKELATVLKVAPEGIVIALVCLSEFIPKVPATCPIVTSATPNSSYQEQYL